RAEDAREAVAGPCGLGGLSALSWWPLLSGRKTVLGPSSLVVMDTTELVTTKWTRARAPKVSRGSLRLVPGSVGWREWAYCTSPAVTCWVKSVLSSMVAIGRPLTSRTRSMERDRES